MRLLSLIALLLVVALARAETDPLAELEKQIAESRSPAPPPPVHHSFPDPHDHPEPHHHLESHRWLQAFSHDFMQKAVLVGLLAGGICSWLGVFVVLRRMVFVGVALSEVASAGVALGVFMRWNPIQVALILTLLDRKSVV